MNILITGGNGQVGFELQRQFAIFGNILAPTRQELDLTNAQAVDAYLGEHQPALILIAPQAFTLKVWSTPPLLR